MVKFGGKIGTLYQMLKNAFKKHPLQNRTNVQIKGGGGQRPFEQCSKKLHFFEMGASLIYKEGHRLDLCILCFLVAFPAVTCLSDKLNMALDSRVFRQAGGQEDPRFRPEVLSLSLGGQVGCSRHHYLTQS